MKFKRILSFILITVTILTLFAIPVAAENDPLVNTSTISSNSIVINDRITLNASGYGGTAPYTYAYYYKHTAESTWHCIKTFSEDDIALLSLHSVDTYDICIKVKDDVDTVVKKYFVITVSDGPLSSSSYISTDHTFLGESIICHGVGVGGTGPYTYAMYYKRTIEDTWHCLQSFQSNCVAVLTPQYLGIYDICIKVHDSLETEHKLYFQTSVQAPPFSANAAISSEDIWLNESVYMSANAEDGNPPYLYAFYAKHNDEDNWTCLRAFSDTTYYTFTPEQAGTYELCIQVQDDNDTIMEQYFILTVHDELSADDCYISSTQITLGETITMVGRGKGGTQPYQYAFYYKRQENSDWSCAQSFGSNNVKDLTPQCATNYDICIKIKDANNTIAKKYFYNIEVEEPGFYIHYYNYDNWNNVKIYYTDGQNALVQQPGVDMTPEGDGWYSYKITNQENVEVVFNDGGNNQVPATTIQVSSDMWYRNGVQTNERPDEITVYFYKPSNWSTPNIYYYLNNNDTGPAWPGVEMEEVSDGWYVYHITKYATANVKFNDGTSQIPAQNQSGLSATDRMWYKNGVWCNETSDTDNDGLLDYQELLLGTNINLPDTDGDTLPDGYEVNMLNTDPLDTDTNDNNVSDANEDIDGDQLSNYAEYQNQTNPLSEDTDGDGLTDYEELHHLTYTTLSPTNPDTDEDGANDGWEINHNTNPIIYNNSFTVQQSIEDQENDLSVNLTTTVEGEIVESINAEFQEDTFDINSSIPGYLGQAIKLTASDEIDSAVLSFTFDEDLLLDADFVPAIYYYNETTQCLEEISTTVNGHTATANLTHFSTYILLNKTDFESVWDNEIRLPSENASSRHLKVALVVDCSGSMSGNLSTTKNVLNQFVNVLDSDDQVAVVGFTNTTSTLCNFTTNTNTIQSAIDNIWANGLTSIHAGISTAENLFDNSSNYDNLMIVITDGIDEPSVNYDTTYVPLIQSANNGVYNNNNELIRDHITIYTIGIGNNIETSLLNRIATGTHGSYYHATAISDLEDQIETIQEEMIDYTTDSNNDGISDYYTKQIVSGGLRYGTHAYVFRVLENGVYRPATLSEVQANADFDNDGLENGDEIEVLVDTLGHPYIAFLSDPSNQDTDGDGILDDQDDAPVTKGYANGVIGKISIVASLDRNIDDNTGGHVFLLYESYVNDTILNLDGLYNQYLISESNEQLTYHMVPADGVLNLHKDGVISLGNSPDANYSKVEKGLNLIIGLMCQPFESDSMRAILAVRSLNNMHISGGIFCNLELATTIKNSEAYADNIALSRNVTEVELNNILTYMKQHNKYNILTSNCTNIATNAWNTTFNDHLNCDDIYYVFNIFPIHAYTPSALYRDIYQYSYNHRVNLSDFVDRACYYNVS